MDPCVSPQGGFELIPGLIIPSVYEMRKCSSTSAAVATTTGASEDSGGGRQNMTQHRKELHNKLCECADDLAVKLNLYHTSELVQGHEIWNLALRDGKRIDAVIIRRHRDTVIEAFKSVVAGHHARLNDVKTICNVKARTYRRSAKSKIKVAHVERLVSADLAVVRAMVRHHLVFPGRTAARVSTPASVLNEEVHVAIEVNESTRAKLSDKWQAAFDRVLLMRMRFGLDPEDAKSKTFPQDTLHAGQ